MGDARNSFGARVARAAALFGAPPDHYYQWSCPSGGSSTGAVWYFKGGYVATLEEGGYDAITGASFSTQIEVWDENEGTRQRAVWACYAQFKTVEEFVSAVGAPCSEEEYAAAHAARAPARRAAHEAAVAREGGRRFAAAIAAVIEDRRLQAAKEKISVAEIFRRHEQRRAYLDAKR